MECTWHPRRAGSVVALFRSYEGVVRESGQHDAVAHVKRQQRQHGNHHKRRDDGSERDRTVTTATDHESSAKPRRGAAPMPHPHLEIMSDMNEM